MAIRFVTYDDILARAKGQELKLAPCTYCCLDVKTCRGGVHLVGGFGCKGGIFLDLDPAIKLRPPS